LSASAWLAVYCRNGYTSLKAFVCVINLRDGKIASELEERDAQLTLMKRSQHRSRTYGKLLPK